MAPPIWPLRDSTPNRNTKSCLDRATGGFLSGSRLSLSKNGLSGFITRQAAKLMRDKMYEVAVEEGTKRFLVFHVASFLRFMAANLSLTQLETWARPR